MEEKEVFYIATFNSTFAAMEGESILEKFVPCRLVPIPTELSAGCGMVLKTNDYKSFLDKNINFVKIFEVEKENFTKKITEIKL